MTTFNPDAAKAFLEQNDGFAKGLTEDDLVTVEEYADHHAGGLIVLWRYIEDNLAVKTHDSWGGADEEGRDIVVHIYSLEDESVDIVNWYATGHEALEAFLSADADTKEK